MNTTAFDSLPEIIRTQIDAMAQAPETPKIGDIREKLAINWNEKFALFNSQTHMLGMHEAPGLSPTDNRGFIALTYSGSLISIGPKTTNGRWIEYVSIKLRADVPDIVSATDIVIKGMTTLNSALEFEKGPILNTSALYRIAVCAENLSAEEQDRRIREAAIFLTNGFMKINRNISESTERSAEQFTIRGMASYIARKNNITAVLVKQVLDDFLSTAESGLLLGERVSLGRLGQFTLKIKPAQKARVLKNPLTKEEILVAAKPASPIPRLSIPLALKRKAAMVDPERL